MDGGTSPTLPRPAIFAPLEFGALRWESGSRGALSARVRGAGDVVSLVVDVGSYNTKGGFAGDEVPKAVIPSVRPQPRSADAPVAAG